MPVVPFNNVQPFEPQRPQMPDEPWALMAAAQMHSEGRLVQPIGQKAPSNIDLNNRPMVKNPDGSTSTVRSITVTNDDGSAILLPTVVGGKVVSNKDAIDHYHKTGEHLGKFDSEDEANSYAETLHKSQAKQYGLE